MAEPVSTDALDAVIAAPRHHKVLLENSRIRVLETILLPGDETAIHTHVWPGYVYIVGWSDCVRHDPARNITMDSRAHGFFPAIGSAHWAKPLPPHSLRNVGSATLHTILTEFKDGIGE